MTLKNMEDRNITIFVKAKAHIFIKNSCICINMNACMCQKFDSNIYFPSKKVNKIASSFLFNKEPMYFIPFFYKMPIYFVCTSSLFNKEPIYFVLQIKKLLKYVKFYVTI